MMWVEMITSRGRSSPVLHTSRLGKRLTRRTGIRSGAENFFVTSNNVPGFQGIQHLSAMKTFPALAFVAALVAFVLFPLRFEIAGSILFAAGFVAIAFSDYTRISRPLRVHAPVAATSSRKERFGLAA